MRNLSLSNIADAVNGRLILPEGFKITEEEATAVVTDSRKVIRGAVFIAVAGERVDGHSFIGQVFEQGALAVICERMPEEITGPVILVEKSLTALKKLAEYYRQALDIKIVGIVGSVGKTSTKELVAAVLSAKYRVLKTEGNFNNEIGVPLTILSIREEHEVAVVEMGISDFGEMTRLGTIVKPDAVVMTNIGPCHLEFLKDLDGVLKAKSEVIPFIKKGGFLCVNKGDAKLATIEKCDGIDIVGYGEDGAVTAAEKVGNGLEGSDFKVCFAEESVVPSDNVKEFSATVKLPGEHMILNSLAAAAVGAEFGLSSEEISRGIAAAKPVSGRSNLIRTDKYLLVDDCYNANPKSMMAAIDLMKDAAGRRVAILGDMFELGDNADLLHAGVGEYAVEKNLDILICVGELSENMYEAAVQKLEEEGIKEEKGMLLYYFKTKDDLVSMIPELPFEEGDTILFKASHGMNFGSLIDIFKTK